MSISNNDLIPSIGDLTQKLWETNEASLSGKTEGGYEVTVVMKRILIEDRVPSGAQRSGYKNCKDIANVTIVPPNEGIYEAIKSYFLSEKIPGSMGAPARLFFDEVHINEQNIIG